MKLCSPVGISLVVLTSVPSLLRGADKLPVVELKNARGQAVGTAMLSPSGEGLRVGLDLKNLPPGEHAIHIHQFANVMGRALPAQVRISTPIIRSTASKTRPGLMPAT